MESKKDGRGKEREDGRGVSRCNLDAINKERGKWERMRRKEGEIKNLRKFYGILAYIKKK